MDNNKKAVILQKLLQLAPFEGFSDYALNQAAAQSVVNKEALRQLIPGGIAQMVALFHAQENEKLRAAFADGSLQKLRVPEKIETIILHRLADWQPMREAIKRLISYNSLPWNILQATQYLYDTVDTIWRMAGDQATDFNFYTKRLTLAGVYSSTVLFWLEDTSADCEETRLFLKRRLENVAGIGKMKKKMQAWVA